MIAKEIDKYPIGVFDSGYGGLTVLKELTKELPQYDYIYFGDNARAPYGSRSFESVYECTLESVQHLFKMGCKLVILACNTASAKALRTIQQKDLRLIDNDRRVLGVIRPTTEIIGNFSDTNEIGIFGTVGTVLSNSYPIEIQKFFPKIKVFQEACPHWVSLVESGQINTSGADFFIQQHVKNLLNKSSNIDTILLACTHYPLLLDRIKLFLPSEIKIVSQGQIVAKSLKEYLIRHIVLDSQISRNGNIFFYTSGSTTDFDAHAQIFYGGEVQSRKIILKPNQ